MRFSSSIFGRLLEPIDRRRFQTIVDRHDGDAYCKSFTSWDHLVALLFAQMSAADGLRGVTRSFNAQSQHHYHLGCGPLSRSTLSDANKRRPVAVFAETFALLAGALDRRTRGEAQDLVRLIDSTPIPLSKLCDWAKSNGRIRGMKMHVVYDPESDRPSVLSVTNANVNDVEIGRTIAIEKGATYVFDKGYCRYEWWTDIDAAGAVFVTRPKKNMKLKTIRRRPISGRQGDGFEIRSVAAVRLASKGDSKLAITLRRVTIKRENGERLTLLTNDAKRSAGEIASLYKSRWRIELLFRWIKQHLKVRKFWGNNDNAIRLQLFAAMIVFALLRIATRTARIAIPILRFANLVAQTLFERRNIAAIEKPPPENASDPLQTN
jgi:putative transposase